ncbi:MAG: DegT/DnrJ/EryC1/StrS family aminotransferase [Candidatus Kuenenia sp.]|nr:DegT/DnrJ/EryC1/StrS family aminotransferase [Candidatus Kuenenia sp.]
MKCEYSRIAADVKFGKDVKLFGFVNLYGCAIGDNTKIGSFVEVQKGAVIGCNVKLSSHTFVCEGVVIEDNVFVGHGVTFINDKYPVAAVEGEMITDADWNVVPTVVRRGASIGSGATILCGIEIGEGAVVGAGATVTKTVPSNAVVAGNPARIMRTKENSAKNEKEEIIPFVDLPSQWEEIKSEAAPVMLRILNNAGFIGGPEVSGFEKEFASYIGVKHCVALSNGTAALYIALKGMGIGKGDEVITAANTFIATAEAIALTGATPVLVDIEQDGIHPSIDALAGAITDRTKAIIPVHLYGFPMDLLKLSEIAKTKGIKMLEDACQAHGARFGGENAGTYDDAAAFSFYPGKNLGAFGDAGALLTNDDGLAEMVLMFRNHGLAGKFDHRIIGSTERMDSLQAAGLRIKLRYLDKWNARRREIAQRYIDGLSGIQELWLPVESEGQESCYHLFVVRHNLRDKLAEFLAMHRIETGMHYPVPIHLSRAFSFLNKGQGSFPNTEKACATGLSLPMSPHLSNDQCDRVIKKIREFFSV